MSMKRFNTEIFNTGLWTATERFFKFNRRGIGNKNSRRGQFHVLYEKDLFALLQKRSLHQLSIEILHKILHCKSFKSNSEHTHIHTHKHAHTQQCSHTGTQHQCSLQMLHIGNSNTRTESKQRPKIHKGISMTLTHHQFLKKQLSE